MHVGGRWVWLVLMLGALFPAFDARAGDSGPLLVFETSAEGLPQGEIRAAIERELGTPLATRGDAATDELTVAVDVNRRIVVRYRTKRGSAERYLPMPSEPSDVALIISLAAGNLARNQASEFEATPPFAESPIATAAPAPAPKTPELREGPPRPLTRAPSEPDYKRNFFGVHVAQDIAIVGGSNVCDANLGQKSDNYACFYEGTDNPFWHTPFPFEDGIETGPVLATTRLLFSYDRALSRMFGIGGRLGFAFGGGPPAGQSPTGDDASATNPNDLPDNVPGAGGTAFFPVHVELRGTFWAIPIGRGVLNPYLGASFGTAQVDAKTTVVERDCADTFEATWDAGANGDFEDCRNGRSNFAWRELPETRVDAWKKMGQGFASFNLGAMFNVVQAGGVVVNLNTMYMFPASGIVFEPSLGVFLSN